ncbi:lipid-A-disaccharide synthase [Ideonella sp.]|uniref:lipid-A-disaccharide synthase n=1 Tax=Ideonella sp. TaxID=1929293 RepID=UPI0035B0EB22
MATTTAPQLALVAGEASGDLLASLLLRGLRERWPGARSVGIGGPRMAAEGFEAWWPSEKLSVFGYVDALRHYRELVGIRNALRDRLLDERPDVFIGVDAPDFNFGLETALRAGGIRTVHFVCPSIWAWRGERVKKLAAAADHVLCLFPFEPALLASHGVSASFVGHPLADTIPLDPPRAPARAALGLSAGDTVVALLPGSRRSEIRHIAPSMLQAATRMARQRPGLRFVLPVAPGLGPLVEPLVAAHAAGVGVQLVDGRSHEVLAACDVTLIASGTATLEAALFKRPMVITYRLHWLNWLYMRRRAYQPWFGLPNILSREFIVPELMQDAATPEALAREALAWLDDASRREALGRRLTDIHLSLRQDTARKAGDAIAQVLGA